jgi:copper chaperone
MESKTFKVPNMTCNGCVNTVRTELEGIPGVEVVEIQKAPQLVTVQLDKPETWNTIEQALIEINYAPAEA